MRRREFITFLAVTASAWPLAARARAPNGMARIGFLGFERRLEKFRQGMRDLGYVEGRDIVIKTRWAIQRIGCPASLPSLSR